MSQRQRLQPLIDEVVRVGLSGGSMQSKLAEIVDREDLNPEQIKRIAEASNRQVSVSLIKDAHARHADPRIKFELCDPDALISRTKEAALRSAFRPASDLEKVAAVTTSSGDPFRAPDLARRDSRSVDTRLSEGEELAKAAQRLQADQRQLEHVRADTELVLKQAGMDTMAAVTEANHAADQAINAAVALVQTGVTLPSLYTAVCAAVNGPMAGMDDREAARKIMKLVIEGLRERQVPVMRMGFARTVGYNEMEKLTSDDLVDLCELSLRQMDTAKEPKLAKLAAYFQHDHTGSKDLSGKHPYQDAEDWLARRPSAQHRPLDPEWASNTPGGEVRVINGDNEFIIAVKDLISARERKLKLHDAQEYIGLRLKQIDEGIRALREKRAEVEAKQAAVGSALAGIGRTLLSQAKAKPLDAIGAAGGVAQPVMMGVQQFTQTAEGKAQRQHERRMNPGGASGPVGGGV